MRYLDLRNVLLWQPTKDKKIKFTKEDSEAIMRDRVAEHLFTLCSAVPQRVRDQVTGIEYTQMTPRNFNSLAEQKTLSKVKDRVLFSDDEIVQLGNDEFTFVKESVINMKGLDSSWNTQLIALATLIEDTEKKDEMEAELTYKAYITNRPEKSLTMAEVYTAHGITVEIIEPVPVKTA